MNAYNIRINGVNQIDVDYAIKSKIHDIGYPSKKVVFPSIDGTGTQLAITKEVDIYTQELTDYLTRYFVKLGILKEIENV
jgi:hypothetical protein